MAPKQYNNTMAKPAEGGLNSTNLVPTSQAPKKFITKQEYQEYLQSESWKELRLKVLEYYNYQCYDCDSNATEVHHISYEHLFFDEEFDDCIPLCHDCHVKKHFE